MATKKPKFSFEVWGTDRSGKEFLRMSGSEYTEKKAHLESGNWKNATHFRLISEDGSVWREWGMNKTARIAKAKAAMEHWLHSRSRMADDYFSDAETDKKIALAHLRYCAAGDGE